MTVELLKLKAWVHLWLKEQLYISLHSPIIISVYDVLQRRAHCFD
jgi:hypothetical protein